MVSPSKGMVGQPGHAKVEGLLYLKRKKGHQQSNASLEDTGRVWLNAQDNSLISIKDEKGVVWALSLHIIVHISVVRPLGRIIVCSSLGLFSCVVSYRKYVSK